MLFLFYTVVFFNFSPLSYKVKDRCPNKKVVNGANLSKTRGFKRYIFLKKRLKDEETTQQQCCFYYLVNYMSYIATIFSTEHTVLTNTLTMNAVRNIISRYLKLLQVTQKLEKLNG